MINQFLVFLFKHNKRIYNYLKDAIVNMYGSTAYGVCFNDSSCDISIEYESTSINEKSSHQIINDVFDLVSSQMNDLFKLNTTSQQKSNNKLTLESKESNIIFNFTNGYDSQCG